MIPPLSPRRSYLPVFWEAIATVIAVLLYRVRTRGREHIPATGGAIIIVNHLSYVDPVVLQLACPRPIRFFGHKGLRSSGFFDWVFRLSGALTINAGKPTEAIRLAIKAVEAGEIVAIFPEGSISRTGQLMAIRRGFELIARKAGVPVIPAYIDGIWGSVFSFAGNSYLWKSPRLMPTHVFVVFGPPLPGADRPRAAGWGRPGAARGPGWGCGGAERAAASSPSAMPRRCVRAPPGHDPVTRPAAAVRTAPSGRGHTALRRRLYRTA